jgi:MFS family permease
VTSGEVLRSRNLLLYLVSRFCAASAMTMLRAAVAWHVFELSRSAFHLGLIGVVQFVPAVSLTLVAGAMADARDRRRMMIGAQAVALVGASVLCAVTLSGAATLAAIYAVVFLEQSALAFDSPARQALLPTLVPREVFPRAVTLSATVQALAFASGPAVGGIVIAAFGIGAAYALLTVLTAAALVGIVFLRAPAHVPGDRAVSVQAIREGLGFVRRRPVVLGCMTLDMFAVIFGGATALLPIYANEILHVGARGYGLLSSTLELGAIGTSIVLATIPPIRNAGRVLLVTVAIYGVATIIFGFSRWFPLSVAAYLLVGAADQVSVVLRSTVIQLATPDALRGRVSGVNMVFINASNQLGAAESGFLAALTSAPFAVVGGGIGCLLVVAIVATALPQLRAYRIDSAERAP